MRRMKKCYIIVIACFIRWGEDSASTGGEEQYVSVAGVNPPSDKRSARMRRDSEKCYVG